APLRAQTVLRDKSGQQVGTATLTEGADGVRVRVPASHLPPGPKAVHVHAVGTCDPPDFVSAGAHFNPAGRKHGRLNPDGSHAGDLPNLVIDAAGSGGLDATTQAATLKTGAAGPLFGEGGARPPIPPPPGHEKTAPPPPHPHPAPR